ncbi:MAG: hypothetical protein ACRDT8_13990 [Micromonosporaceae bacterium]
MPRTSPQQEATAGAEAYAEPLSAREWGKPRAALIVSTAIGALATVLAWFSDWLWIHILVKPIEDHTSHAGIERFGLLSIGFGVGLVLVAGLLGLALWPYGRLLSQRVRNRLSLAALAVCAALFVDAGFLIWRFAGEQDRAAERVHRLRESMETLPPVVGMSARSLGIYLAALAVLAFTLVAVQLPRPELSIWIQMGSGVVLSVVVMCLPWLKVWFVDDTQPRLGLQSRALWMWSIGTEGAALAIGLVLAIVLTFMCLRAPGYARERWALSASLVGGVVFFQGLLAGTRAQVEAMALGERVSELIGSWSTGTDVLTALAGALFCVAAVRSWWHGREEVVPPSAGDKPWLPGALAGRRDR